jgi:hypothetical protein
VLGYRKNSEVRKMKLYNKRRETFGHPIIPLIVEMEDPEKIDKSKYICMDLKIRAAGANTSTYKKYIRKFEEGTPQEFIDLLKSLEEIWVQNSVAGPQDRSSIVRSTLMGETLANYDSAIMDETAENVPLTTEIVNNCLKTVAKEVFPHRALERQRQWMIRDMRKPYELSTRKYFSAVARMNNALPKFPEASEESKFSELELIRLLEYSLPHKWQQKFDYDNYIPTEHDRTRLLRECEAIERNQAERNADMDKKKKKAKDASTSAKSDKKTKNVESRPEKHCDECGKNFTHNTAQCWKIQKRNKAKVVNSDEKKETKRTFSNKGFRKEVNLLAKEKGNSKRKVLDMYADAIKREKAKLKSKKPNDEATESESEMSVDVVEVSEPKKKKRQVKFDFEAEKKKKKSSEEQTPEEKAFLKKVMAEEANSEQDDSVLSDSTSDA